MSHLHRQLAANIAVAAQQAEKGAETHAGCTPTMPAAAIAAASSTFRARAASSKAKQRRKATR